MKIIDQVIAQIEEHRFSGSTEFLAIALASACNSNHKVSLLDASVKLDSANRALLYELMNITQQPDFDNYAQARALIWLRDNDFIK